MTEEQQAFLDAYAACGYISGAARKLCKRDDPKDMERVRRAHYRWLEVPEYAEAFRATVPQVVELLEAAAWVRAVDGWDEPVYQGGQMVGTVKRFDGGLLKFLLRGNIPDKYGEKITQHHEGGAEIVVRYVGETAD
jgi:hypothetical protein